MKQLERAEKDEKETRISQERRKHRKDDGPRQKMSYEEAKRKVSHFDRDNTKCNGHMKFTGHMLGSIDQILECKRSK